MEIKPGVVDIELVDCVCAKCGGDLIVILPYPIVQHEDADLEAQHAVPSIASVEQA